MAFNNEIEKIKAEIKMLEKKLSFLEELCQTKPQTTNEIDISKVLIEGDIATIMGVKYQRVETPQSFYDKLWGLLKTKLDDSVECDYMADQVRDLIREHIPKPYEGMGLCEYFLGYNKAIKQVKERLFNGIQ